MKGVEKDSFKYIFSYVITSKDFVSIPMVLHKTKEQNNYNAVNWQLSEFKNPFLVTVTKKVKST